MSLRLPSEIVVDRFIPTVRATLAAALDDRGFTQQEIADRLGVTQAAVSKYLAGDARTEDRFIGDERLQATVDRIADGFADDTMDDYEALSELLSLVREFEDRGPICAVHEEEMPALRGLGCDLCVRGTDANLAVERDVLENVRKAVRVLENAPRIVDHVPNVGSNVGMALPEPENELDVAAVPGRIHTMRGRLAAPGNPEFGASKHVATAVLAAATADPDVRAAVNLATSDELLAAARDHGVHPVEFDPEYENRRDRLEAAFRERGAVPRVIYHRGAYGIEPITYVYGETAVDAARFAVELAD